MQEIRRDSQNATEMLRAFQIAAREISHSAKRSKESQSEKTPNIKKHNLKCDRLFVMFYTTLFLNSEGDNPVTFLNTR